ncbi:MAG TPA: ferritin [Savagea sp.]
MLSEKLANALNQQMNEEFAAAHYYLSVASYCEDKDYSGFANFYLEQAKEERFHGMKIYNYLNDRGVRAIFTGLQAPETEFSSLLQTFERSLAQEKKVTKQYYALSDIAWEEKEYATISFLQWFLDEQVEEESMFDTHIQYLTRIADDKNALFIYEKELASRQFSEEE